MDIIKYILKKQNIDLLNRIADDVYKKQEDKDEFIDRYDKINFRLINTINEDNYSYYKLIVNDALNKK
jgi:hypothetical protein